MKISELKQIIREEIRALTEKKKEVLILSRTTYTGEGEKIDNSKSISKYKVGGTFTVWAAAPGSGKENYTITKIDKKGIWGVVL